MRAKFFVVRKIRSIDKVPRNVGLMTRDKVRYGMCCALNDSCGREKKREKERKRVKKSEREQTKRENLKFFRVFFVRVFCSFSSLSLCALSDALRKEQTP